MEKYLDLFYKICPYDFLMKLLPKANNVIKTKHVYVGLLNDDLIECSSFIRIVKKVISTG